MRNILDRLISTGEFEAVIFGDKVILDESIDKWPHCDFLISFFSKGFPLEKAMEYVKLRQPFCVNDLPMQQVLWDRRLVLGLLDAVGVPTPPRLQTTNGSDSPSLSDEVIAKLKSLGLEIHSKPSVLVQNGYDTIEIDGKTMDKPFVEKPISGEDHNVYIFHASKDGGGVRKLFRKVGNKSSAFCENEGGVRQEGSYIYEQFMESMNAEDVKVYTIGQDFAHAETRKSPVVDGVVRRNAEGKEIRYVATLTEEEKNMARIITSTFGQSICGFDLLRTEGKSYVIDVNGWSFVKGNAYYYDKCAQVLCEMFLKASKEKIKVSEQQSHSLPESQWKLKGFFSVMRHGDRTPKQKVKFFFKSMPFTDLLNGATEEVVIKKHENLQRVIQAARDAAGLEDAQSLAQLEMILVAKSPLPGTKVQIKPSFNKMDNTMEKVQCIVKWGGEFTHSGLHHTRDLGLNLRKDLSIINRMLLEDVKVFTSSERRVIATADIFCKSFLKLSEMDPQFIKVAKEMLDDSNAAKDLMEQVKARLRDILNPAVQVDVPSDILIPQEMKEPAESLQELIQILSKIRVIMTNNFETMDVKEIQKRWCCSESPFLFKERWEKLFRDFCDVERSAFDTSKISELHDSLKYDLLHNRHFVHVIFSQPHDGNQLFRELYNKAKIIFTCLGPHEYGITNQEKLDVGIQNSLHLLRQLIEEIQIARDSENPCTRLFFTKESKVMCLLNIVLLCGLKVHITPVQVEELDYLTQITFELYERKGSTKEAREYSLRIEFSPGAHDPNLVDLELDSKHALSVAPRVFISDHIPLEDALAFLSPRNIPSLGLAQLKSVASESEDALFNELEMNK